jgi:hypothetical protein
MAAQTVHGRLVCQARARAGLVEGGDQCFLRQQIRIAPRAGNGLQLFRDLKHPEKFVPFKIFQRQNVPTTKTAHNFSFIVKVNLEKWVRGNQGSRWVIKQAGTRSAVRQTQGFRTICKLTWQFRVHSIYYKSHPDGWQFFALFSPYFGQKTKENRPSCARIRGSDFFAGRV